MPRPQSSFMTVRRLVLPFAIVFLTAVGLPAQSTVPAASQTLPAQAMAAGGVALSADLRNYFSLPGVTGQVVQFDTVLGKFNFEMLANDAPATVTNFLNYVNRGAYNGTFIHRSVPGFVLQGGGYTVSNNQIVHIAVDPPVVNEYKLSNLRATVAMAKSGGDPNSATSEWFVNLGDNSSNLNNQNGGFTVFARVIGGSMNMVDTIAGYPRYNIGFDAAGDPPSTPLRDVQPNQTQLQIQNLIVVNSASVIPLFPTGAGAAVVNFSASSSDPAVVAPNVNGSTLSLSALASGSAVVTVRATETGGGVAESAFGVTVSPGPVFTAQPESRTVSAGGSVTLTATAPGATGYQWQRNGVDIAGATSASFTLNSVQPSDVGVYLVRASDANGTHTSEPAIVALTSTAKVIGAGSEVGPNIQHANGNIYDQVLLTGSAATITADPGQIVRISYVDATDDIVQVEFGGAGALTLSLADASGPAAPVKYNQPTVSYMKGRATIVIAGADATTNVSVFSVGRATAVNQTLFRNDVTYDGMADIALLAVNAPGASFGGIRTANTNYSAASGLTGVYAPRVAIGGPLFVGDISASSGAAPALLAGSASDVRITGGDLAQANSAAVRVDGMTSVQMRDGSDSHGNLQPAQPLRGRLERSGVDVTAQLNQ